MNAYEFDGNFRKKIKGMNFQYIRDCFKYMSKDFNFPLFKSMLPEPTQKQS